MYRYNRNFSEKLDKLSNSTKFCSMLTKAALFATIDREKRYNKNEVQKANKMIKQTMRDTQTFTKRVNLVSTKVEIKAKALMNVKEQTGKLFNKPVLCDMIKSQGL